jgi:polysaccharide export outer membrane protein
MNRFFVALLMICGFYTQALSQIQSNNVVQPNAVQPKEPNRTARTDQTVQKSTSTVPDFIIGSEDVLFISVWREPDFTVTARVRNDGKISFPLLDDIQASGLTTDKLQKQITAGLEKFVNEPQVTVIVQEIHSQMVHVMGSVPRPGAYDIRSPLNVVELLARAGGVAEPARAIVIVRTEGIKTRRFRFDYERYVSGENLQQNIPLRPGDVIIVP